MKFLIENNLIPRNKIKKMDFYFSQKQVKSPFFFDEMKNERKEKMKILKLKEPVKQSCWVDFDSINDIKEKMKILKLKEPVKKSCWIDDVYTSEDLH
jgi:hypothetical protein